MPVMTNAEAFEYDFGIYATELWSMTEEQFLTWLNAECDRGRPRDMIVRCKDCKHYRSVAGYIDGYCHMAEWYRRYQYPDDYCSRGERKDDDN